MASIFINDIKVTLPEKTTILQACDEIGIDVPRFCFHERLLVAGNCRMCLVEVEKTPKPVPSCTMTIADVKGKRIYTKTPLVKKAQESVLEFLLINHPLDCPICDQGGECDLQDQSVSFGSDSSRFYFKKRGVEDKNLGPIIKTVMTRCIHCTRCIRFATEVAGLKDLGTTGRGKKTEIGTYVSKIIKTNLSGNIVDLCPVGALTSKPYAFKARSWELKSTNSIDILDSLCSNIVVQKKGNDIVRILPRTNDQVNEEWLTDKARYSFDSVSKNRLDVPLMKTQNFNEISWEEAFNLLYKNLKPSLFENSSSIRLKFDSLADLETVIACENINRTLKGKVNIVGDKVVNNSNINLDFMNTYRSTDIYRKISNSDLILLVNVDLKNEIPLLNVRLTNAIKKSGMSVGLIGFNSDYSFNFEHLGFDLKSFINLIEGKNQFLKKIIAAKSPLILFGENCSHWNLNSFYTHLTNINKNINLSVLNHNVTTSGSAEFGYSMEFKSTPSSKFFIDIGHISSENEMKTKKGYWVYIGSHGHEGLKNYDLILPATTYLEKESHYLNLTGLLQKTGSLSSALPQIRKESDILNFFLMFLKKQHDSFDFIKSGNIELVSQKKILNNKDLTQDISNISINNSPVCVETNFNTISSGIDKYCTSNRFSQSSKIMNTVDIMNNKVSYFSKN